MVQWDPWVRSMRHVAAGSRIGVVVMSSDFEYTVRPAPGTELTLSPLASTVQLPIVGGMETLQQSLKAAG